MKRFFAAAAFAPLCFAAAQAHAQTSISTATTTPVVTSTSGDVTIETVGSITVTAGDAVTLDAPGSKVENKGNIIINDASTDVTGILVTAPSGTVLNSGVVVVADTDTPTDTDRDGDLDGPFVTDTGVRYGIHVVNPFTGSVTVTGGIGVKGNSSAGIAIDSALVGDLRVTGVVNIVGHDTTAIRVTGPVTGSVTFRGTIDATGQNAVGLTIDGGASGPVVVDGDITVSGFRYRTRSNFQTDLDILDADDLLVGGPALRLQGAFAAGFVLDGPPPNLIGDADEDGVDDDVDEDDDTIPDASEPTGQLFAFGSAPAIILGGAGATSFADVGAGGNAYGVIVRGQAIGIGLFDGFNATGAQIGGLGGTVSTGSGVLVAPFGTLSANSYNADAVGLLVGMGSDVPKLTINSGSVLASLSVPEAANSATAILIDVGASLPRIDNTGTVVASINGLVGTASAIVDRSGTLSQITNDGVIGAQLTTNSTDPSAAVLVALDLSANATGVTFTQDTATADKVISTTGDVFLGSGADAIFLGSGSAKGDWSLGGGANSLQIDGALFTGGLDHSGTLSIDFVEGELNLTSTADLAVTTLNVGPDTVLRFTANPLNADPLRRSTRVIADTAIIADGAKIGLSFASKLSTATTFELISSPNLTLGGLNTDLLGDLPFLYRATLESSSQSIQVNVNRRTAAEAGLTGAQALAFESFFEAFDQDSGVNSSVLGKSDAAGFGALYEQILPDYAGGPFHSIATSTRAMMQAHADDSRGMAETSGGRSWLQEIGFGATRDGSAGEVGYNFAGFGLVGGVESKESAAGGVRGLSFAFVSSDVDNDNRSGDSLLATNALMAGAYWRNRLSDYLVLDASATAGYAWFDSDRDIIDLNAAGARVLRRQAGGQWSGAVFGGRAGATYHRDYGNYYVRPDATIDYVYLLEGGYTEIGAGAALNLKVDSRQSYELAAEAGLAVGARFGRGFRWGPEIRVGYRSILSAGVSDTTARFAGIVGGTPFTLPGLGIDEGRVVVRAAIRGGSQYALVSLEANGDIGDLYQAYSGRLVVRFLF